MTILLFLSLFLVAGGIFAEDAALSLGLDECLKLGLANNPNLRDAQIRERMARAGILKAKSVYDPLVSANGSHTDSDVQESGLFSVGERRITSGGVSLREQLPGGIGAELGASHSRSEFGSTVFNVPPYLSSVSLSLSLSLLQNAMGRLDQATVRYAELVRTVAECEYERRKDIVELGVAEAYWDLYARLASYEVGVQSLELASDLLESNRARHRDGLLDETDIIAAEASLALRNVEVAALSNQVDGARDRLSEIIRLPRDAWSRAQYQYAPASRMKERLKEWAPVDVSELWLTALRTRPDIEALRSLLNQAETDMEIKQEALKPDLELVGGVSAGADASSFQDSAGMDDAGWTVGIQFQRPLLRDMEKSELRRAKLAVEEMRNNIEAVEDSIFGECRAMARALRLALEQVAATERAVTLREKNLNLEKKKFDQGRSDTRWVIQAQDDLANVRMAHHVSLAEFEKKKAAAFVTQGKPLAETNE